MGPFLKFLLGLFLFVWSIIGVAAAVIIIIVATQVGPVIKQLPTMVESGIDDVAKSFTAPRDENGDQPPRGQR